MMTRQCIPHLTALATLLGLAQISMSQLQPEWISRLPLGVALSAGMTGMVVDPSGVSYVTGTGGPSSNTDIYTAAFGADGTLIWSEVFNGPQNWHDQGRGIALGPGGVVWVCGNTPGPGRYANVMILKYDAASGALLDTIQYSSGAGLSEHGQSIVADAQGNIYVAGGTVGDSTDVMILSFDDAGNFRWRRTWDGPAFAPYSQDHAQKIMLAPDGNIVVMIDGVMANLHADYVIIKYAPANGATIWEKYWGSVGDDFPVEMEIANNGDIFVTGTALDNGNNRYGTIRLRGTDGQLLWQNYSGIQSHDGTRGMAIDRRGGVYVTGSVDPDGDRSNSNDNFYSVKLDDATGTQLWSHSYGDNCVGCFDAPGDIEVDSGGNVWLAGSTSSAPYAGDMILFILDAATGTETNRGTVGGTNEYLSAGVLRLDSSENLLLGGGSYNVNTGAVEITVGKYRALVGNQYAISVQNLVGGQDATFSVLNATPNRRQYIVYSLRGPGSTYVPQLNVTLDLSQPVLLTSGPADANGNFTTTVHVPPAATGRRVWFQNAELNRTTSVISDTVR